MRTSHQKVSDTVNSGLTEGVESVAVSRPVIRLSKYGRPIASEGSCTYSNLVALKSTVQVDRSLLCRSEDRELGRGVDDIADADAVPS